MAIRIERRRPGRRVGRRCVAARPRLRRRRACARFVGVATLTRTLAAGRRSVGFSGRIGRRALPAGSYRAVVIAVDAAANASLPRTVAFTVAAR